MFLWPVPVSVVAFAGAAVVIGVFGVQLAAVVDRLADRTGIGEAIAGAVLLGSATSLAGFVVTVVAAAGGEASLAVSNSAGGIAAQTTFVVVADLVYRRANIEHAAASITNVFTSLLLVVLLAIVLMGVTSPDWTVWSVHPATPLLLVAYAYGIRVARTVGDDPMWWPRRTPDTRLDIPDRAARVEALRPLVVRFALLAAAVSAAGFVVAEAGIALIERTGLGGTMVGTFFTSVSTSIPELVTSVAAVRAGALTLAIGGIVGGNTFDVLFVAVGDVVFREGSIYAALTTSDSFVLTWTTALVAVLGAGLIRRQRRGIGFEGVAILGLYLAGVVTVASLG